jgi:hypothetical protein
MSTAPTPWWQAVLGGIAIVVAAIITGTAAYRVGRKTPFDTLKALVDILDKSDHLFVEDQAILKIAVHHDVQRIERLNEARSKGYWTYQRQRFVEANRLGVLIDLLAVALFIGVIALFVLAAINDPDAVDDDYGDDYWDY